MGEPFRAASGWARSLAHLLGPQGMIAGRLALERQPGQRVARLAAAGWDRACQRARPSRGRMRALQVRPGARFSWRSVPAPAPPGPLGAVVRPLAVATCDMDRPLALGATPFPMPLGFGHECVAEVLSIGSEVSDVRPGQRVVVPFQVSCGACPTCRQGRTANCEHVPPLSMYGFGVGGGHWGAAVADELAVPFADAMLVPLPDGIEPAVAASVADNVSDAYRHVAPHLIGLGERRDARPLDVLVVGAPARRHLFSGSLPLYTALVARALGAGDVVVADARLQVQARAGALGIPTVSFGQAARRTPVPLTVDASGCPQGQRLALRATAADGVCSSAGGLYTRVAVPYAQLYGRNVTLSVARAHVRAIIPDVLDLVVAGTLRPQDVTTVVAPMDEAASALRHHVQAAELKTILVC